MPFEGGMSNVWKKSREKSRCGTGRRTDSVPESRAGTRRNEAVREFSILGLRRLRDALPHRQSRRRVLDPRDERHRLCETRGRHREDDRRPRRRQRLHPVRPLYGWFRGDGSRASRAETCQSAHPERADVHAQLQRQAGGAVPGAPHGESPDDGSETHPEAEQSHQTVRTS